ncbi:MAG: hypothetical protein AAGG44_03985 [Planctomycetota bacterium]
MAEPPVVSTTTEPSPVGAEPVQDLPTQSAGKSKTVAQAGRQGKGKGKPVLENRLAIFLMILCVTGFLGIPILCMSPAFSKTEKWIWSIVVTIYTCILIAITAGIVWYVYSMYAELYS